MARSEGCRRCTDRGAQCDYTVCHDRFVIRTGPDRWNFNVSVAGHYWFTDYDEESASQQDVAARLCPVPVRALPGVDPDDAQVRLVGQTAQVLQLQMNTTGCATPIEARLDYQETGYNPRRLPRWCGSRTTSAPMARASSRTRPRNQTVSCTGRVSSTKTWHVPLHVLR